MHHEEKETEYSEIIIFKILNETAKAYQVSVPITVGDTGEKVSHNMWLPKSQVEIKSEEKYNICTIPDWLLEQKRSEMQDTYGKEVKIARPKGD